MIKTIRVCDSCGIAIGHGASELYTVTINRVTKAGTQPLKLDCCASCAETLEQKVRKMFGTWIDPDAPYVQLSPEEALFGTWIDPDAPYVQLSPEEAPQEAPKKKVKLDVGKVEALYKANWDVPKIADEMKVSKNTIYKALRVIREKEEK